MTTRFEELSEAEWYEDLGFLVNTLLATHPDPFTKVGRNEFESGVEDLRAGIPGMRGHAIVVGLKRVLASIQDGHAHLAVSGLTGSPSLPPQALPVQRRIARACCFSRTKRVRRALGFCPSTGSLRRLYTRCCETW